MIVTVCISLIIGCIIGTFFVPYSIPVDYSNYLAVAIFACLDSVFGAMAAHTKQKFDLKIFITGFFTNSVLAAFLAYMGDKLGADIYLATIFVFVYRMFSNFATIRIYLLNYKITRRRREKKMKKLLPK